MITNCFSCCRLCLEERSEASIDCLSDELDKVIENVLGFEIRSTDECSTKICLSCFQKLSVFHLFKVKAVNNQKIMQQMKALHFTCNRAVKMQDETDDVVFVSEEKANCCAAFVPFNGKEGIRRQTARKRTTQIPLSVSANRACLTNDTEILRETSNIDARPPLKRLKIVCHSITEKDVEGFKLNARDKSLLRLGQKVNGSINGVSSSRKQNDKQKEEDNITSSEQKPVMVILKDTARTLLIKGLLENKTNGEKPSKIFNLQPINATNNESFEKFILRWKEKQNTPFTPASSTNGDSKTEHTQNSNLNHSVNGSPYNMIISRNNETLASNGTCQSPIYTNTRIQIGKSQTYFTLKPKTCTKSADKSMIYSPLDKDVRTLSSPLNPYKPDSSTSNAKDESPSITDSKVKVLSVNEINKRSFDRNPSETTPDKQPIRISILKTGTFLQIRLADTKNNEMNFNALKPAEKLAVRSTILHESHRKRIFYVIENNILDNYSKELLQFLNIPYKQPVYMT